MQGVFDQDGKRFPSKKALKEAIAADEDIYLEATSLFGNEYGGNVSLAPVGVFMVVGPDPYNSRKWYATIHKTAGGITVV